MFATEEFIESSRKFVCIRIETFENKQSEAMVRQLLDGKFENTAFTVFDPTGTRQLTRAGRSPSQVLKQRRGPAAQESSSDEATIARMNQIAKQFKPTGNVNDAELQDFNTLRQALNVASADQRLLVFVVAPEKDRAEVALKLKSVLADPEIVGKFHLNFADEKLDGAWNKVIHNSKNKPGILIVRASEFGLDGQAVSQLSLNKDKEAIKKSLLSANEKFAKVEQRKDYATHVRQGKRQGIYFENEIPYGEDHDGDGKADSKGKRGGKR